MKQFDSGGMRGTPVMTDASSRPIRRKGFFARLVEALHASRRLEARRLIRRYRHLIAEDSGIGRRSSLSIPAPQKKARPMPTEITRPSTPIVERSTMLKVSSLRVSPLTIAATIAFVVLHLISGALLEHSHASPVPEPSTFAALAEEAKCSAETPEPKPALPYD